MRLPNSLTLINAVNMHGELNDTQIRNLLSSQSVGRLACTDGEQPYIVPVTYVYDGTYIFGQTNEGMKLKMLRKNPKVCFEVDSMIDMRNWQSVIILGKFEELKNMKAKEAREILFEHVYELMTSSSIHTFGHEINGDVDNRTRIKNCMYRIIMKKITGRFEKQ